MALSKLSNEWRREHPFQFCCVECSGVFPSSFEGVQRRVKIAGLAGDTRPRGSMGGRWAGESLHLLQRPLAKTSNLTAKSIPFLRTPTDDDLLLGFRLISVVENLSASLEYFTGI